MSSGNLISVIVTCYNQGKFLSESLESVLNQSHENWECLIIDDGSTDETEQVGLLYQQKDKRFSYFRQPNQGVASARNLGLDKCNGDFIQFLDADDHLHLEKFATQLTLLNSNLEIDVVFGSSRYFVEGQPDVLYPLHSRGSIPCDITYRDKFQVEMLLKHNICSNCSALYRRGARKSVRFRNVIFEDWVYNLECALNGMIFHFDNSFSSYSYIRMTDSSQMKRHTLQVNEIRNFNRLLMSLVKEYQYSVSPHIITDEKSESTAKLIDFVRSITPPFIFSVGASLKRKLFS